MERFTYRDGTKWARAEYDCRIFETKDEDGNDCFSGELIDRLAELEDKLEQKLMIKLPCKVGDTVWVNAVNGADSLTIKGFHIQDNGVAYYEARFNPNGLDIRFNAETIGKTVFLTESEAQAELERRNHEKESN